MATAVLAAMPGMRKVARADSTDGWLEWIAPADAPACGASATFTDKVAVRLGQPPGAAAERAHVTIQTRIERRRSTPGWSAEVRVLDTAKGTGAVTRVLVDSTNGDRSWTTIGVSENIIEASWQVLYDSLVYGLLTGQSLLLDESAQ